MASLLSQFNTGSKVQNGLSLDFNPYFVFGGRVREIDDYRNHYYNQLLANLQASLGTIQGKDDTSSTNFALGLRATFVDDHDLLQSKDLGTRIDETLRAAAKASATETGDVIGTKEVAGLTEVYRNVRRELAHKPGNALSLGYAYSGRLKGSVLESDSLDTEQHHVWISYTRYQLLLGMDVLSVFAGNYVKNLSPRNRLGVALHGTVLDAGFTAELVLDSSTERTEWNIAGEHQIIPGLDAVLSLGTDRPSTNQPDAVVRAHAMLRWNSGK